MAILGIRVSLLITAFLYLGEHISIVLRDAMYMIGGVSDDDANAVYEFSFGKWEWWNWKMSAD